MPDRWRNTVHVELALVSEASPDRVVSETDGVRPCPTGLIRDGVAVGVALGHYARYERQHVVHVPAAQRNALDLFLTDGRPQRRTICLQWRCLGGHHNTLSHTADLQRGIDAGTNTDLDLHSIFREALETSRFNLDSVLTGTKIREDIGTARTGLQAPRFVRAQIRQLHRGAHDRCPAWIGDGSQDRTKGNLSVYWCPVARHSSEGENRHYYSRNQTLPTHCAPKNSP